MSIQDDMRDWLLDCFEDDYDQEQIKDLTLIELERYINKYYCGGVKSFMQCNGEI